MSKFFTFLIYFSLIGTLYAANSNESLLTWLKTADPQTDATQALKQNDKRLMAVYGYTLHIPGTKPENFTEYQNTYGLKPIEGTSDMIESEEHGKLNALAFKYAKQYNNIILGNKK